MRDPFFMLLCCPVMARPLDRANEGVIELKRQVHAGEPGMVIGKTVAKIEQLLSALRRLSSLSSGYAEQLFCGASLAP